MKSSLTNSSTVSSSKNDIENFFPRSIDNYETKENDLIRQKGLLKKLKFNFIETESKRLFVNSLLTMDILKGVLPIEPIQKQIEGSHSDKKNVLKDLKMKNNELEDFFDKKLEDCFSTFNVIAQKRREYEKSLEIYHQTEKVDIQQDDETLMHCYFNNVKFVRKNDDEWVLTVKDAPYQIVFDDLKLVQVTPLNDGKQDGNKGNEDVDNHLEKIISFAIEK